MNFACHRRGKARMAAAMARDAEEEQWQQQEMLKQLEHREHERERELERERMSEVIAKEAIRLQRLSSRAYVHPQVVFAPSRSRFSGFCL